MITNAVIMNFDFTIYWNNTGGSDDDGEGTIVAYMGNSTGVDGEYALVMTNIR